MEQLPEEIGGFQIVKLLGAGGMGRVYEGLNPHIHRRVAIKVLKPKHAKKEEHVARFLREAQAVNAVPHPSLVQITEHGKTPDGLLFLVMEFLRGETLYQRMEFLKRNGGRLTLKHVVQFSWQIADALTAAHAKGIIHRDIKPQNIMLVPDPPVPTGERVKLLDFGLAKQLRASHNITVCPKAIGTPPYMSPEQWRGQCDIDGATDVYALGITMYEMLTGRPPFQGSNDMVIGQRHLMEQPAALAPQCPGVPEQLCSLVHRALRKHAADRPSMAELAEELKSIERARLRAEPQPSGDAGGASDLSAPPPVVSSVPASTKDGAELQAVASSPGSIGGQPTVKQEARGAQFIASRILGYPMSAWLAVVGAGMLSAMLWTQLHNRILLKKSHTEGMKHSDPAIRVTHADPRTILIPRVANYAPSAPVVDRPQKETGQQYKNEASDVDRKKEEAQWRSKFNPRTL